MTARFFASGAAFDRWLETHHARAAELWVGFHKKHVAKQGLTYLEAVEVALCWGWIDGLVRRIDDISFEQRFSPRASRSTWSLVNVARVERLTAEGRMRPAGQAAFAARSAGRTGIYSFEQPVVALTAPHRTRFRAHPKAWSWFSAQPPSYRRVAIHWVESAKRLATRDRRLTALITASTKGKRLPQFTPAPRRDR